MSAEHRPLLRIGDREVHPARGCIVADGLPIHVKPRPMQVLERLARAPGVLVTRRELFDSVWPGQAVSDDALTQCIVELRRALGDDSRAPRFIETLPRRGFRLIAPVSRTPSLVAPMPHRLGGGRRPSLRSEAVGALVIVLGLVLALGFGRPDGGAQATATLHSVVDPATVAVLPFEDLSPDQDQNYLADGLAEEVLDRLAQFDDLRVTARTSSFRFRDPEHSIAKIGERLGVDHVLRGSVRRGADRLRISAQLIDARTGFNVWARSYDRRPTDLLRLQTEIADSVAMALGVTLSLERFSYAAGGTSNIDAFEQAMRGRALLEDSSAASIEQAIVQFKRAIELDPDFAAAWTMLAQLYTVWGPMELGHEARAQWADEAAQARQRALALAPNADFVLSSAANAAAMEGRFVAAQQHLNRLIEAGHSRPTYAEIDLLAKTGRRSEAHVLAEAERRLDPMGRGPHHYLAHLLHMDGQLDRALEELEAEFGYGEFVAANAAEGLIVALTTGDEAQIDTWLTRAIAHQRPADRDNHAILARLRNDPPAVRRWLREAYESRTVEDYWIIVLGGLFDDPELSLAAMRRSRDAWAFWIPATAKVRQLPGFRRMVEEIGLVAYWRDYGWGDYCRPTAMRDYDCSAWQAGG